MQRERSRVVVGVWLLLLAGTTLDRVWDWRTERGVWAAAAAHAPYKPRPWLNLGQAMTEDGMGGMAEGIFAHAAALARQPGRSRDEQTRGWAIARTNLAIVLVQRGQHAAAQGVLKDVLQQTPEFQTPRRLYTWLTAQPSSSPAASY